MYLYPSFLFQLNDKFVYPMSIDLEPFTKEGLERQDLEAQEAARLERIKQATADAQASQSEDEKEEQGSELVHSSFASSSFSFQNLCLPAKTSSLSLCPYAFFSTSFSSFCLSLQSKASSDSKEAKEAKEAPDVSSSTIPSSSSSAVSADPPILVPPRYSLHPASFYEYVLVGVVVHSGSAQGGHYYSLIKERKRSKMTRRIATCMVIVL